MTDNFYIRYLVKVAVAAGLLVLGPAAAWAVCTAHGTATSTSSQVVPANDIAVDRHYLLIQNTGANPMNVAIGTNNKATSADMLLNAAGSIVMTNYGVTPVPNGDVSVISTLGTTWAFCDY